MKRTIIALSMGTALVLTGCSTSSGSGGGTNRVPINTEVEDCDADDLIEKDEDCGFKKATKKPTSKPKSVTRPKAPSRPKAPAPAPRRK